VTLSGNILFSALDGSAQDSDGLANGVFTVNGDLAVAGTINCNDDPPLAANASACPIRISVSGDLTMEAGSGIFAENRRVGGDGREVRLDVGGDVILRGSTGGLPGAVLSSSRTSDGSFWKAGNLTILAGGNVELEAGSKVAASTPNGAAGTIAVTAGGPIRVAGLIAAGPSRTVLPSRWSGLVLDGASNGQVGGAISLRSHTSAEPGIVIDSAGIVASQGEDNGAKLVLLEACGIEVRGLVASVSKQGGPSLVALRSGKGILVDGRDLGSGGSRLGRVRADGSLGGAAGYMVDLFAGSDIQVLGPDPSSTALFAVSSSPGAQAQRPAGGMITAISLSGSLTAANRAFEAGRSQDGNKGGVIDLKARNDVSLDGASLAAVGDFTSSTKNRAGGRISARSFLGTVSWTFGVGDVRPTGTGVSAANRGTITLTACTTVDTNGTQFPVTGGAVPPFPVENEGVCSPAAPQLPVGEPPLPVCNQPPVANAQTVMTDEDTPVTITLTGSDSNSDPLTFSIVTPPAHGSLGPLTSPTATSVQVVYTPGLNYNGPDFFTFQVDDGHGGTATATVTLTVKPVNDPPEVDEATFTLPENSPNGTAVGTVTFSDPDAGQTHTFSILLGNTGGAFAIDPSTGAMTVANSAALNFEMTPTFSLTVQVTDDGSPALSGTATVTINLNDVNEAPVVSPATFTIPENSSNGTAVGTVTFSDPDAGQMHVFSITGSGAFAINPTTGAITVANSAALDFETTPSFSLTVQVTDSGSPALSGTATITVNLTNVNEAPVVNPATFNINENSAAGTAVGTVTFTDPDVGQSHTFSVTGGNVGGAFAINPTTGEITVAGTINFEATPSFSLTVQVTDSGSLSGTATITISVNNLPEPPTANPDSYDTIGNTLLQVAALDTASGPHVFATGSLLANDVDQDVPSALTTSLNSASPGAQVTVNDDGTFTYVPPPGAAGPTDTFTYSLTDGTFTVTGTVTIRLKERVWYIKNDAEEDGNGTSVSPFNAITAANLSDDGVDGDLTDDVDSASDYIFVYFGDGTTTRQTSGILLEGGQHLIGEHVGLTIPIPSGTFNGVSAPTSVGLVAAAPGNRPMLDDTVVDAVEGVSARDVIPTEIVGLNLAGNVNGIDWTTTGAFNGSGTLTLRDNVIRSATVEGVDINLAGTGAVNLAFHDNVLTSTGTALDIQETGTGSLTITAFHDNAVGGNTAGTGININTATFDSTPGGALNTVDGGATVIGASGNGVGGAGMVLTNMQGDLHFSTNLNIFADGGAGLFVSGTGAGMQLRVNTGGGSTGIIEATGGPAVDVAAVGLDLRLTSLKSTNSATTGVSLETVTGIFSAASGSSIANATGTAFRVNSGTATINYDGTISNSAGRSVSVTSKPSGSVAFNGVITDTGTGVFLNGNAGSAISFTKQLSLSTGGSDAFTATGGGTVTATDTTSTISTTTGLALNVQNSTIGFAGLKFASVSAGTAASGPTSGIVLSNTGSSGGLTVNGGTIQKTTSHGVSLTSTLSPSFTSLTIKDTGGSGVKGTQVTNFSFINGSIDNSAMGLGADESNIAFNNSTGTENNVSGTVTITGNSLTNAYYHGIDILNFSGTLSNVTVSGNTITSAVTTASSKGSGIRLQGLGSGTTVASITKATVSNNLINNFPSGSGILMNCGNASTSGNGGSCGTPGSASSVISVIGNTIAGQSIANKMGSNAIAVAVTGGNGASRNQANFDISGNGTVANPLANFKGSGIACTVLGMSTATCNVTNNVMVANNIVASRCIAVGVDRTIAAGDTPDLTATISDNRISACDGNGIFTGALNSNGIARIKVQNNNIAAPLSGVRPGIQVNSGTPSAAGTTTTVCLNISGNTSAGSGGTQGIGLRKEGTAPATNAFGVNGMVATSSPGVEGYVDGLNPAGGSTLLTSATNGFTNCALP